MGRFKNEEEENKMKIFLLGATGKTGTILLKMALDRGHHVTAYVRNPERTGIARENLHIVKGDVFSVKDMSSAMGGHDVVVSCLGGNDNDKKTVIADMTQVIVDSMELNHIKRLITISSAGIHDEFSMITNLIVKMFYKHVINDHKVASKIIMSSGIEYTLARPLSLTDGELTKKYRKVSIGVPKGGKNISREDLVHFLLGCIETGEHKNETVGLAY